jgi:hypothetical protein
MQQRVISSIREIAGLTLTGTLVLLFVAEIVLTEDVFFVHPVVVLAISSIAVILWYWGQNRRVT